MTDRRPNDYLQERVPVSYDHAALTAGVGVKIFSPRRKARLDWAKYYNPTGLVAHNDNWFTVSLYRCGAADAVTIAAKTFTAANASEICTATAHALLTGDGPVRLTTTTTLPAGLSLATDYYIIKIDANTFYFAASRALAFIGTAVTFTDDGTGTHTLTGTASARRPVAIATGVNTDADGGGASLAADAPVTLTLTATTANLVLAAGDDLMFVAVEGGTTTLPIGRATAELLYL